MFRHASSASGGIGRRARFRSVCPKGRGGSTPPSRTAPRGTPLGQRPGIPDQGDPASSHFAIAVHALGQSDPDVQPQHGSGSLAQSCGSEAQTAIALPDPLATSQVMSTIVMRSHTLADKKRSDHQHLAIRPSLFAGPENIQPRAARTNTSPAPSAQIPPLSAPRTRDGRVRVSALSAIDGSGRVFAIKPVRALGWGSGTALVAERTEDGLGLVVIAGRPTTKRPALLMVSIDAQGRLKLPPTMRAILQVTEGEQVMVTGTPDAKTIHVHAVADLMQHFVGSDPAADPKMVTTPEGNRPTRVKPRKKVDSKRLLLLMQPSPRDTRGRDTDT